MKTRHLLKLYLTVFLTLTSAIFFNPAFSIDPLNNAESQRYTTALLKVNITSQNYYSACVQAGSPPNTAHGIWGDYYSLCPINSFQSVAPTIDGTAVHNCICNGNCPGGYISKYGNAGLKVTGIKCTVPVSLWLPASLFNSSGSGQTITLFGTQVYASNTGGTQVFIQPSASTDTFNITVDSGASIIGPDAAFLKNFITINMFQNYMVQFQGCGPPFTGC